MCQRSLCVVKLALHGIYPDPFVLIASLHSSTPNALPCAQLSALLGEESVRVLRESGGPLWAATAGGRGGADGGNADEKPVDSVTVGREGLFGEKEEAKVMPVLRLAVVKDDQVRFTWGYQNKADQDFQWCTMFSALCVRG